MALTDVALCSRALILLGEAPITSLETESAPSQVANTLYATVLDAALASYPWRFALVETTLAKESSAPANEGWQYAYQLPSTYLHLNRVMVAPGARGSIPNYEVVGELIYTNVSDGLLVETIQRPVESKFPPHFVKFLVYQLASDFAIAVTENADKWDVFSKLAEREQRIARHVDSRQRPSVAIVSDAGLVTDR